jgi:hypothetical protein
MSNAVSLATERLPNGNASRKANWVRNHARIEQVRTLLARGWTRGEIKNFCSQEWNLKRRCVEPYYEAAIKRTAEHLAFNGNETLANSLTFWSAKLTETEEELDITRVEIARLSALLKHSTTGDETQKIDAAERKLLMRELDGYRKRHFLATEQSMEIYDRIDRLRGHVHSGGSASVLIQQNFVNGGQSSLNEGQRREQLAAIGMVPAAELPLILDVPAVALPTSSG